MTSIKNQIPYECDATCFIYGPLAAIEGVANLYFNDQFLDYELSVQHILDCDDEFYEQGWPDCLGSHGKTNEFVKVEGVMDNNAYERDQLEEDCRSEQPPDGTPQYWVKIKDYHGFMNFTAETLKEALINHGPLIVVIDNFQYGPHSMALVGYGTLKIGDTFHNPLNTLETTTVDSNSDYIGHLYWKLKNSWGTGSGDQGYFYYLAEDANIVQPMYYELPIDDILTEDETVLAFDKDNDGYWNWGISESYDLPAGVCSELEDSDDSENRLGPFDATYHSVPIMPEMKVYIMRSVDDIVISENSFLSFTSEDLDESNNLDFFIENTGTAQLNLQPHNLDEGKVEIIPVQGGSSNFQVVEYPAKRICWGGLKKSLFSIRFSGNLTGELAKVKIYLDENGDIHDFEFILVYYDCQASNVIQPLTGDNYWSSFELKPDNYLVTSGATLNITGEIALGNNSNIYIAPGGELILDGGRLTSGCGSLWKGIDVWGDRTKPQLENAQGIVRVRNNGIIEHARVGIENLCWYNGVPMYTGGIFDIAGAEFKDNQIAVKFWPYHNINPLTGQEVENFSRIKNTEFKTTQNLYDLGFTPQCFISMTEVKGVKIVASTFINETLAVDDAGVGIYATAADFTVDHYCPVYQVPCPAYVPCHFENLEYGIHASAITTVESAWIRNSEFINNKSGIYLSAYSYPDVIQNIYEVRKSEQVPFYEAEYCGLYLDNCTQYDVEENNFYTFLNEQEKQDLVSIGLIVNNSGEENNIIYNNTFDGLYNGIIAQDVNRNVEGDRGLQIKCNDFIDNSFDIAVTDDSETISGIAYEQGSDDDDLTAPAGNIFSIIGSEPEGNFYNQCEGIVYWCHSEPNGYFIYPARRTNEKVEPKVEPNGHIFDTLESCPSHLIGGGQVLQGEKENLLSMAQKADSIQDLLYLLTDGGDTEGLLSDIQFSWPEDAFELYSDLITESPYLSDTTMIKAIEKEDVLLPGMITDVLVANPQSAKSDEIMNTVDERSNPLTDNQLADIGQGRFIIGAKESLESRQAAYLFAKDLSKSNIIRSYKADTLCESPIDSIINILNYQPGPFDEYRKAFEYFAKGDSLNVVNVLDDIPLNYDLNAVEENEQSLYEDYFDVFFNPDTSGSLILNLDSTQKIALHYIVDNSEGILKVLARNILILTDSLDYTEPIILPQPGLKSGKVRFWPEKNPLLNDRLIIYPNPANSIIIIDAQIKEESRDIFIKIIDSKGITLKSFQIKSTNEYLFFPVSDYSSGNYFIQLIINEQVIESKKLVIVR